MTIELSYPDQVCERGKGSRPGPVNSTVHPGNAAMALS